MKKTFNILIIGLLLAVITSCGKDNFDEPGAILKGKIVYNGQQIQVRGTGEAIQLQLYQDGYALKDPINVFVGQDGTFSAALFNGEYKLVMRENNGPWVYSRDALVVNVKGTTEMELNVTPFFTISDENISISGSSVNASFTINQIVNTAHVEKIYLILSKTQFADEVNNIYRKDISDVGVGQVNVSGDFGDNKDVTNAKFIYGRVGVKTNGTEQAIWSPVVKLK
ncbi:MAG: DUF3823 domain-containing protein [Tannerella sp.]|jgi:hypothetical protein|nr:DUF3823 domain-containing protein [Tannerella sp.]